MGCLIVILGVKTFYTMVYQFNFIIWSVFCQFFGQYYDSLGGREVETSPKELNNQDLSS